MPGVPCLLHTADCAAPYTIIIKFGRVVRDETLTSRAMQVAWLTALTDNKAGLVGQPILTIFYYPLFVLHRCVKQSRFISTLFDADTFTSCAHMRLNRSVTSLPTDTSCSVHRPFISPLRRIDNALKQPEARPWTVQSEFAMLVGHDLKQ